MSDHPDPAQVKAVRERLQRRDGLGITAAQDVCAAMLHTSRRAWQQWEAGDRRMHPAFFELVAIKIKMKLHGASSEASSETTAVEAVSD